MSLMDVSEEDALLGEGAEPLVTALQVGPSFQGKRLDQCFGEQAQAHSRAYVQSLIEQGAVTVDGVPCLQPSRRVRLGQKLVVEWRLPEAELAFVAEPMDLAIVHEDDDLLVVNKAPGMVVHPAAGNWRGTLMNGLLAHHAGAASLPRAGIVHRLDKDTSGLMVVAKTLPAYHGLVAAIAARTVRREYLALCHGLWGGPETVDAPIGRDPRSRVRMAVVHGGREAKTDFMPLAAAGGFSLMHCQLHTGRTHQIRVHAAHRRHPLVGDLAYGGAAALGMVRQALHATRLSLIHPSSGLLMRWQQHPPADMDAAFVTHWGHPLPGLPA